MKVILAALNAKYVHLNLAVYDLYKYAVVKFDKEKLKDKNINLDVREYTINQNLSDILMAIYSEKPDVVAFSCYIWNIQEVLIIGSQLKKVLPDIQIWLGGPEVSYDCKKMLESNHFVDGIMVGEGEKTFCELLGKFENRDFSDVKGIIYRNENDSIENNGVRELMSLDEVPFVYDDLSRFSNKILYYESSRGCPFSCSYCLSSIDKTVRFRNLSAVERDLKFFLDNKVRQVKFIDRTFNCNKKHSDSIWKFIAQNDNGVTNFHFEVAADLIGDEQIEIFRTMRPGLIQLEIGLQSTNPCTIKEIHRIMDIEKLKNTLAKIKSLNNIHQHLDLIAGLPFEDFETFKKSFNEAYSMKPDQLQLGFLKVLKGSYMWENSSDYEIIYQDIPPYEVMATKWITFDEILKLKKIESMVEEYYNSGQFINIVEYLCSAFNNAFSFYEALAEFYNESGYLEIGLKRETKYVVLREFAEAYAEDKNISLKIVDDLLTYDYYLRENAKARPVWAEKMPIDRDEYMAFFKNNGNLEFSLHLDDRGLDYKTASRLMHIEVVGVDSFKWITKNNNLKNMEKDSCKQEEFYDEKIYCLFDYENKNPLSNSAHVVYLGKL